MASAETDEACAAIRRDATTGQHHLWVYNRFFFEMEWNGVEFFFLNPTFALVPDLLDALGRFGFKDEERLVRKALALFPDGGPAVDDEERQAQVDRAGEDAWQELQEQWRQIAEASTGDDLRKFIVDHAHEYFRPAAVS
jgi:hypothetical protein